MVSLYAKKTMHTDILIGRQEITCEPRPSSSIFLISYLRIWLTVLHVELDIVLNSADGDARHSTEPAILSLTITVLAANASSSLAAAVQLSKPSEADRGNAGVPLSPLSQTEISRHTLRRAEEAINTINTTETWKRAVNIIKRVMDTVSPIAAVRTTSFLLILR
jgi:hypothetical protein